MLAAAGCRSAAVTPVAHPDRVRHEVAKVMVVSDSALLGASTRTHLGTHRIDAIPATECADVLPADLMARTEVASKAEMDSVRGRLRQRGIDAVVSVWFLPLSPPIETARKRRSGGKILARPIAGPDLFSREVLARGTHPWCRTDDLDTGVHAFYLVTSTHTGETMASGIWREARAGFHGSYEQAAVQSDLGDAGRLMAEAIAAELGGTS
jgi:hypothetical protein